MTFTRENRCFNQGVWLCLALLVLTRPDARGAATEPIGLNAMAAFERLPYLKLDTAAGGQSSYDRSGGNGDLNNFLYTTNGEQVLLDLQGPGTVYRIWFTGFDPAADYIKVYFDGEAAPRINSLLTDIFSGTNAPFLAPLDGDDNVSSGGFFCYLPLPFAKSIRIVSNATSGTFYYNIGYHVYSPDTPVTTWTGDEDSSAVRTLWSNAGADPKSDSGNVTVSNSFTLPPGATQTLLDISGPRSISSIKLRIPGIDAPQDSPLITDDGRAQTGYSQFRMALDPLNTGATLVRRFDYGIADQTANVYVNGSFVGQWSDPGSDGTYHWRDSTFNLPSSYTTGRNSITVKIMFVSSAYDWNEFHYWAYSLSGSASNLTDTLDVGNTVSESDHSYMIQTQTWSGVRTYQYPPPAQNADLVDLLTNLWLKISFDNETNPSVAAPVGSFFAMGQFEACATRGLPVGMDSNSELYVYFPMPFAQRALVQLVSGRSDPTTNISCEIKSKSFTDSFANVGYFKTQFSSETPTTNGSDILMLDADGAGHLVGVVESMMGPLNRGYLEGDERIYVDDSLTPSIYGTGTEDFYNAGWYFNRGVFTQPTHGNPAHVVDATFDRTAAYRFFMQDAIPFRKHIRVGIEHGGADDVSENVWTAAYYYCQQAARSILTDQLDVGHLSSETPHAYTIHNQVWGGTRTSSYDGDLDNVNISDDGRAHTNYSEFTMTLLPANAGAVLRRRLDQIVPNQSANVFVDGALVGTWYRAGANSSHRWRDDDFMIPAAYTAGKSSIQIRVQSNSSSTAWYEFNYALYAVTAPPLGPFAPLLVNSIREAAGESGLFHFDFGGTSNASYSVWSSTNMSDWMRLGAAAELAPGQFGFTDSDAALPQRFYRVSSP